MKKLLIAGFLLLIPNSAYLACSAAPHLFYVANVFYHVAFGCFLVPLFAVYGYRFLRFMPLTGGYRTLGWVTYCLMILSGMAGVGLMMVGNTRSTQWILHVHIVTAVVATGLIFVLLTKLRSIYAAVSLVGSLWRWGCLVLAVGIVLPLAMISWDLQHPNPNNVIENPAGPPMSMDQEAMLGKDGPFFPSSAETSTGGRIPSTFFMTSQSCGTSGCHPDIYQQWNSSAHHFSSFNNQWYRKSIEYMQEVVGIQPSKWCAGCHDQAVLFNGMFDQPISEIVHTPEAQAGIGCNGCHAIVHVKNTMGNGAYHIAYPPLHDLATSDNLILKGLHDFFMRVDPEPHKQTFLKPFHRQQTAEFCSACHKVHLDKPVNHYRWFRGFNEYDNWQASGVSGQGARSFYYPEKPQKCADCHMPLVPSNDAGNIDGYVHNHRFPGANTALPVANQDPEQLKVVKDFLKNKQVRIDLFALSEPGSEPTTEARQTDRVDPMSGQPELASTFAVGEEQGMAVGVGSATVGPAGPIIAPLENDMVTLNRGDSVRLDVVVRTLKVGHFFPGGTVDAFDLWIELKAVDDRGKTLFWSGAVSNDGQGPVEPGAHFYQAYLLDGHGNHIDKRNAWATRAVMYVNLIPPGAADVAHYRLRIPEDCGDTIQVTAKLNYRKFSWFNTQFAFTGRRDPCDVDYDVSPHYDDGKWIFAAEPNDVAGKLKSIPDLPIIVMAEDRLRLNVLPSGSPRPEPLKIKEAQDSQGPSARERWNDYGIGLLRQGDLKGAERAFLKVTELEPDYVDGWVNVARVYLREGNIDGAQAFLEKALPRAPELAKSHYFYGLVLKQRGKYDEALEHLRKAQATYPRDRVVCNAIGRVLFLKKAYADAITELKQVMTIDPEDLQAHYNLMLCYRGLGDMENAKKEQQLYLRFKADESSQAITGDIRRQNPHANNERQPIHEHTSVSLPWGSAEAKRVSYQD